MNENFKHSEITSQIIRGFYNVYNELGFGFLEKVYENALTIELRSFGFLVLQQHPIDVYFKGEKVGKYYADLSGKSKLLV